jgi:hypothetical protein
LQKQAEEFEEKANKLRSIEELDEKLSQEDDSPDQTI